MYAVIRTGGKQYRVQQGQTLKIEKLVVEPGTSIDFDQVLMVADGDRIQVGQPYLDGGKVTALVKSQGRHPKVEIIKFRRRKHYRKRQGHRQAFTEVEITAIDAGVTGTSATA
ncbi:MAG: 50S ribosomal protein L21 [Candidatus Competibacterales bacterium]